MSMLLLDTPMIDYIRFTTKLEDVGREWYEHFVGMVRGAKAIPRDDRFLQYIGKSYDDPLGGHVFVGYWQDKGVDYGVIQAGGAISDELSSWLFGGMLRWGATCKRVDLQVTVEEPKEWSQWELLKRLRDRGRNVSWKPSIDKETGLELATIYIGSRESERLTRIYEKLTAGDSKLLRFETEYKGSRASAIGKFLCRNRPKMKDYLLFETQSTKDKQLGDLLAASFTGAEPDAGRFRRVKTKLDKQKEWLLTGVLPAFDRYVNDDNAKREVAAN